MMQYGSSVSFLEGDGFGSHKAMEVNDIKVTKLLAWPYFYRLIAIPVLLITQNNFESTFIILEVLSFAFLLISIKLLIIELIDSKRRNIILSYVFLFSAILITPLKHMRDIDMFTLGFTLMSLLFLYRYFVFGNKNIHMFLFLLFIAILPQMRYAYIPISLALLFYFVILMFFNKVRVRFAHLMFLSMPLFSYVITFINPYFSDTSSKFSNGQVYVPLEVRLSMRKALRLM
jgi:hypothetical protein